MYSPDESLNWRKSSRSSNGANCVEVAFAADAVRARDSKDLGGPSIGVGPAQWSAFLGVLKSGEADHPS
jgi:hypothetical protein